jgi:DhnA family fructose-bisphosphate aldolase class Ia
MQESSLANSQGGTSQMQVQKLPTVIEGHAQSLGYRCMCRFWALGIFHQPALRGVQLDAACIVVNLLELPGRPAVREACLQNVLDARADCDRYGMPLMVEPLVMRETPAGAYTVNGDIDEILPIVRQAVELGADIIKADPTDDPAEYHHVITIASGIPVLVRGGGKVPDRELFERTAAVLASGASGIVYGRNIIQHPNPVGMTRALMAMLHEGATPAQAEQVLATTGTSAP